MERVLAGGCLGPSCSLFFLCMLSNKGQLGVETIPATPRIT